MIWLVIIARVPLALIVLGFKAFMEWFYFGPAHRLLELSRRWEKQGAETGRVLYCRRKGIARQPHP